MTDVAVVVMDVDDARRLTERIRLAAHTYAESRAKVLDLVEQAKNGNAHIALGYPAWTAYLADVLGDEPLRLARDDRRDLVGVLVGEGMSTRAIAPIVGVSHEQVRQDASTVKNLTVQRPATVTSLDGRERPSTQPRTVVVDTATGEVNPAPRATPRRALTDQFFDAIYDLSKVTEKVARLTDDDRFPQNAEKVAAKHRSDLIRAIDALQGVINRLPTAN